MAVPPQVLVVDDVETLLRSVERSLKQSGFEVSTAASGSEALLHVGERVPDLILTDAQMPGLDGHALCRALRRNKATRSVPIIIMSGEMMDERDIVSGLEGGADDYILKPFQMPVLLARVKAVLRRYEQGPDVTDTLKHCGIELDPASREVAVHGKKVALSRKEFDLLAIMLANSGRVITADFLLESVWGYDLATYNDPHTVETHVSNLRKKLGAKAAKFLITLRGVGYKFEKA